jgi:formate-dependent nitrite reductase membrane component NrfD
MALFASSALLGGCALLALDPMVQLPAAHARAVGLAMAALGILAGLCLAALLAGVRASVPAGVVSVRELLSGSLSSYFWWGVVLLGLVAPTVVGLAVGLGPLDPAVLRLGGICALVGLLVLRYALLAAARRPARLSFRGSGPWGISR